MGEEIERLWKENKELHQSIDAMINEYNRLQTYVAKMKQEMEGHLSSTSRPSRHELIQERQFEALKPNTTQILVKTNEANPSLVCHLEFWARKFLALVDVI